jgi:hypothetical protein
MEALERAAVSVRGLARALSDRAAGPSEEPVYGEDVRAALAGVLEELAAAVEAYGGLVGAESIGAITEETELRDALARAWEARHRLRDALRAEQRTQSEAWELHGALLANVDRLLREIDVEARARLRERWHERRARLAMAPLVRERIGRVAASSAAQLRRPLWQRAARTRPR